MERITLMWTGCSHPAGCKVDDMPRGVRAPRPHRSSNLCPPTKISVPPRATFAAIGKLRQFPAFVMPSFVNISAYKFTPLDGLPALRERFLKLSRDRSLKGTILLSPEGINFFVAGTK